MGKRQAAEELTDALEETPEELIPAPPRGEPRSNASPQRGLRDLTELATVVEFNMSQQAERIKHLTEAHDSRSTILDKLIARIEATADIQEDHMASLEENMERLETLAAALIRLTMSLTHQRDTAAQERTDTPASQNERNG